MYFLYLRLVANIKDYKNIFIQLSDFLSIQNYRIMIALIKTPYVHVIAQWKSLKSLFAPSLTPCFRLCL